MAQPDQSDPFATFDPFSAKQKANGATEVSVAPPGAEKDPFANFDPFKGGAESNTSALGAATRGLVGGAAPGIGSIPAAVAGAEFGSVLGVPGAIVGGLAGAYLGAEGISAGQNWLLNKVPKIRDMLGQSEEQKRADEEEHPIASFLGGIAPFAVTMSPGGVAKKLLPENATTWQRLAANPLTSRLFSGSIMGGMQLGQEAVSEHEVNWNRVALATGFGLVWNKPNRLGERISEYGARPARFVMGRPQPGPGEMQGPPEMQGPRAPTVAEVSEQGLAGPSITNDTFMGAQQRNPEAELAAIHTAGVEDSIIGPVRRPDLENQARQSNPDLFNEHDELVARQRGLRNAINEYNEPKPYQFAELAEERETLEKELADHVAARNGYDRGPRARQLKAQIRHIANEEAALTERGAAFTAGAAQETPELANVRKQLLDTEFALRDVQPRIQAAYKAAGEYTGAPTVAPPVEEVAAPPPVQTPEAPAGPMEASVRARAATQQSIDEQKVAIAKDWERQSLAAGSPPEEAHALGIVMAHKYSARASRMSGAVGSPLELYKAEAPKIIGGRVMSREPGPAAPPAAEAPALPTTKEELRAYLAAGGDISAAPKGGVVPPMKEATGIGRAPTVAEEPKAPEEALPPIVEVKAKAPRGPAAKDPEHYSLFEFLAKGGGLKADPDTLAIFGGKNPFVPGFGPLLRPNGKSIDHALESAVEAGYLHDQGRISGGETQVAPEDLRKLLDEEARGNKQYKIGREGQKKKADTDEQRHRLEEHVDTELAKDGIEPKSITGELRERMLQIMEKEGVRDPSEALERAAMEEEHHGAETGELEFEPKGVPGWDVKFPDESGAAPGRGEEAAARGEQPEGAEVGGRPREPGGGDREQAAKADALTERTAAGDQFVLPGAEQAGQGEMAQRGANAPLRPGVAQKPTDIGLFGDEKDQLDLSHLSDQDIKDFFQGAKGSIRFTEGMRAVITRLDTADASTVIHELGHGWLEDLMKDAAHPAAPGGVQDDAATVLKALGLKDASELTERTKKGNPTAKATKAHEQFARWTEQYMRLGIAPSPELANVFARFKAWLLDLYKTIQGLGKPISPATRAVFDRMLTEAPGDTVIGEHRPGGPTITEIHEADAKLTEPHEGEQARDRVAAERERYAEEQPPEIQAELEGSAQRQAGEGAKPPGEGGAGPSGPGEVVGGGGGPEPVAEGGGGGEEPGKIVEGGSNARPEGATIPGAGPEPSSTTEREHPLATGAAPDSIPRGEDRLVDKAGNIRVENLTNVEDVGEAMHDSADRNSDFQGVRGDSVSKGQLWDLASDLGRDPNAMDFDALQSHLEKLTGGMKDMAQKVLAARRLLKQSAASVADLMKRVAKSDSDEEAKELALAISRHDMIQSAVSGATASWGRTGSAFHDISAGWDQVGNVNALLMAKTGRTLFQIKQIAKLGAQFDKTAQISQFVRDSGKPGFGRMVTEYWINGLISGLQTHMTYAVGNTILGIEKMGPETALAAAIGSLRKSMGREGATVRIGEVAAGLRGIKEGFWPAVQSALEGARTGVTKLLPGEDVAQTRRFQPSILDASGGLVKAAVLNEAATMQDALATAFGLMRGIRAGVVGGAALQRAGGLPGAPLYGWEYTPGGAIPNFQLKGGTVLPVGGIVRAPSRMIAAIHSFFRPLNYSIEIHQRAYRDAANQNLEGAAFDSHVAGFVRAPPAEAMEAGRNVSTELTLMGQGGEITRKLSALVNTEFFGTKDEAGKTISGSGTQLLKFIDPFIHISSNIIRKSIVERSPLGLLSPSLRAELMSTDNVRADTAAARMLAGTALSLMFGGLAAEGYVTGSEPKNRQEAAVWRQVYQAHSIRIGDTWYAMNRLGPMGMLLSTAADLYDVAHHAEKGEFAKAAAALQHAVTQNVLDESFMRGPSDLIKAIEDPARYGEAYIKNFVASFVPFSVAMSQMARASDPYTRDAHTVADAIKGKIPGLSQSLMPRRDVWGEILPSRESLGPAGVLAIWEQQRNEDPVNKALLNLSIYPAAVGRKIRNVELTEQEHDDWARLAGRLAKLRMDAIVRSPSFQNMPNPIKHDLVTEQLRQSREVAQNMMFMKYPHLLVDAQDVKMKKRMGPQ